MLNSNSLQSTIGNNYYFTQNQRDDVDAFLQRLPADATINVVGHSWGGDTAARVALDNPNRISNLITVDPVTTVHSMPDLPAVSDSVSNWVNLFTQKHTDSPYSPGDIVAGAGAWNDATYGIANATIPVKLHHENFDTMLNTSSLSGKTRSKC